MARKKILIKDINLISEQVTCLSEKIPLSPQGHNLLFSIARQRVEQEEREKEKQRQTIPELETIWLRSTPGQKVKRKAYELALTHGYLAAKKHVREEFLSANPHLKTHNGRPPGAKSKQTLILIKVGEIITEMLNRCAHVL